MIIYLSDPGREQHISNYKFSANNYRILSRILTEEDTVSPNFFNIWWLKFFLQNTVVVNCSRAYLVFNVGDVALVQVHFEETSSVQLHSDAFAHNLSRKHQVFQHGVVHCRQRSAPWSLLLVLLTRLARRFRQNSPLQKSNRVIRFHQSPDKGVREFECSGDGEFSCRV